jgi:hypothetical protein
LATVTSVLRRVVAPFAAVTALVATLSACGTGPSQVNSAVVFGDHVISVDQVQSLVDKVVKEPAARSIAQQHKLDLVAREAVAQLVVHDLLTQAARDEGLRVDQDQLAELRAQNPFAEKLSTKGDVPTEQLVPELVYRARGFDAFANDTLLLDALAREHLGRDSASYNLVVMKDADSARDLAEKISATPAEAAGIMRAAAKDSGSDVAIDKDTGPTGNGVFLAAPKNTVFVLPSSQGDTGGGGFQVVQVLSTKTAATTSPDLDLSQVPADQLPQIGKFVLRPHAIEKGVKVSPRYGVWNDAMLTVVPKNEAEVSGYAVLPKSAKP